MARISVYLRLGIKYPTFLLLSEVLCQVVNYARLMAYMIISIECAVASSKRKFYDLTLNVMPLKLLSDVFKLMHYLRNVESVMKNQTFELRVTCMTCTLVWVLHF